MIACDAQDLPIKGNKMVQDREICSTCAKPSGLDDLVQDALALGIHSRAFMLEILQHGAKNENPGREVNCSSCGERFKEVFWWKNTSPGGGWE
ncbi:hypothetical protein BJY04DRAFT_186055 [Aspergillus karnatakaensis]|uniref:uncharacterized protein n=1 Tax=Aspergillus karnatakaensis TaxID=1810916 RepID=UPI003CCD88E0